MMTANWFQLKLDVLKSYIKIFERQLMLFFARRLFKSTTALVLGPGISCQKWSVAPDYHVLLKLLSPDQLQSYQGNKIILFWNGTASKLYLESRTPLPESVHFIFAKCSARQCRLIRSENPHIKVFRFRSLPVSSIGQQTLIVDLISILSDLRFETIWVTGINLRLSEYKNKYRHIYKAHANPSNIKRSVTMGHHPLIDFQQLQRFNQKGVFIPDDELRNILELESEEFLLRFNQINGTSVKNDI